MASPPYNHNYGNAMSPPYPSNAQLPQPKRRVSEMPTSAPSMKRRKTSMLSASSATSAMHPLRQTSFPPENAPAYARSPSVDNMSLVSGSAAGGPTKKKRASSKKKPKTEDTASMTGGAPTAVSGTSGKGKGKRTASEVEVEEEDEADDENAVTGATEAEKEKEKENRSLLIRELDPQQFERYEAWRSSRLPDSTMRRLINQTLSQSVPLNVILAVRAVTKIFAGDLIEGARKVQTQWIEAGEAQVSALPSPPAEDSQPREETRRGPLRPDHLRESLRRYKVSREGGSVGHMGVWQQQQSSGVERFGIKARGRRLLK